MGRQAPPVLVVQEALGPQAPSVLVVQEALGPQAPPVLVVQEALGPQAPTVLEVLEAMGPQEVVVPQGLRDSSLLVAPKAVDQLVLEAVDHREALRPVALEVLVVVVLEAMHRLAVSVLPPPPPAHPKCVLDHPVVEVIMVSECTNGNACSWSGEYYPSIFNPQQTLDGYGETAVNITENVAVKDWIFLLEFNVTLGKFWSNSFFNTCCLWHSR
ncbi:hypothetical protein Hamer_G020243 [Homarus americanus]|uniref:Uncharacterized protein n=2 Tax=Homarus americanus TaxID=6706 RepID=A0A8J5MK31_HOMAM|nr:hypothetical protein Hamer_G020243 [Homarus americanus]